jgi:large subunit ribosomal protein L10
VARPDKVAAVAEVTKNLNDSAATLLTHYRGLSVPELQELRAELRKANASYRVIKNTLSRRAMAEAGIEGLDELLEGPTALVFCEEDPVGPAKALKAFSKDHPDLLIRGGYLDGEVLDEAEATKLADLESREELLAKLAGLMNGALANTARLLQAPIEKQAQLVQALIDAGGAAGAPSDEAPAGDEPATASDEQPAAEEPTAEAEEPAAEQEPEQTPEAAEAGTAAETDAEGDEQA